MKGKRAAQDMVHVTVFNQTFRCELRVVALSFLERFLHSDPVMRTKRSCQCNIQASNLLRLCLQISSFYMKGSQWKSCSYQLKMFVQHPQLTWIFILVVCGVTGISIFAQNSSSTVQWVRLKSKSIGLDVGTFFLICQMIAA